MNYTFIKFQYLEKSIFQVLVLQSIEDIPNVLVLMDNILVHGANQHEHSLGLEEVLKHLCAAGVTLNRKKCCFSISSVKYLGHIVSESGIARPRRFNDTQLQGSYICHRCSAILRHV